MIQALKSRMHVVSTCMTNSSDPFNLLKRSCPLDQVLFLGIVFATSADHNQSIHLCSLIMICTVLFLVRIFLITNPTFYQLKLSELNDWRDYFKNWMRDKSKRQYCLIMASLAFMKNWWAHQANKYLKCGLYAAQHPKIFLFWVFIDDTISTLILDHDMEHLKTTYRCFAT